MYPPPRAPKDTDGCWMRRLYLKTSAARIAASLLWTRCSATGLSRRALEAKFYAVVENESTRVNLWLSVMAGSSHPGFVSSASAGLRPNTLGPCITAYGYKRRFNVPQTPSASPPAPDFRVPVSPAYDSCDHFAQCRLFADSVRSTSRSRRSWHHRRLPLLTQAV